MSSNYCGYQFLQTNRSTTAQSGRQPAKSLLPKEKFAKRFRAKYKNLRHVGKCYMQSAVTPMCGFF